MTADCEHCIQPFTCTEEDKKKAQQSYWPCKQFREDKSVLGSNHWT
jgi:hypothetical protein